MIWLLVPVLFGDMLGICVCLCAVFSHVLSQEAEEPIYTVSGYLLYFIHSTQTDARIPLYDV